ncbi:MAG: hypothetical protein HOO97_06170 [Sideroxydans sp.]|nr:hypothetical protein [Sideroxydans sp.]
MLKPNFQLFAAASFTSLLVACGGGGSGGSTPVAPVATTASVTGTALGGRFLSGQVCAFAIVSGAKSISLGCATIDPVLST